MLIKVRKLLLLKCRWLKAEIHQGESDEWCDARLVSKQFANPLFKRKILLMSIPVAWKPTEKGISNMSEIAEQHEQRLLNT